MNFRHQLNNLIAAGAFAVASTASAQELNMDLSSLVNANLAFDQQMMQQAADYSQQWYNDVQAYRAQTGYTGFIGSGFNAATLNAANRETQAAYDSYNQSWHDNSARMSAANNNFSGYIRGTYDWTDANGQTWQLDNSMQGLFQDSNGQVFYGDPNNVPSGMNTINTGTMGRMGW